MSYRISIIGRSNATTQPGNHATLLTALNSLMDSLSTGDPSLGTYLLERKSIVLRLDDHAEFEFEAVFQNYTHADMQAYLRSVFGGIAADVNSLTVRDEDTNFQHMMASRVNGVVTWNLSETPAQTTEILT